MSDISVKNYWVYILLCDNGSYYTGYTNNLSKRYHSHLTGTGRCKYTRSFKPVTLAQCWQVRGEKSFAMQIERQIKRMSHAGKKAVILRPSSLIFDDRISVVSKKKRLEIVRD